MSVQYAGNIPIQIKRRNIPMHLCESCNVKSAKYLVELDPPQTSASVKHELCENCAGRWA